MARSVKATNRIPKETPRAQYSSIFIAMLGGRYTCTHYLHPEDSTIVYDLQTAARDLKDGGFVIDFFSRALENALNIVLAAPEENGSIEYHDPALDPSRLRENPEHYWQDFQRIAESSKGPYHQSTVASAAIVALYYAGHGIRVGRRVGDAILWPDGTQDQIDPPQE